MRTQSFLSLAVTLTAVLFAAGCQDTTLVSSCMAPTIKPGEKVTVDYTAYALAAPKRWDVVAFEPPLFTNQVWLMRVVALPGETVSFASGGVTVDGSPLTSPPHVTNVTYVSIDHPALHGDRSSIASPYVVPPQTVTLF